VGVRVLVLVEGAAVGAGAAAVALRLNGRLVAPTLCGNRNGNTNSSSTPGSNATGATRATRATRLWWVSQIDTCIPWDLLGEGTHYLSAALVDGAREGGEAGEDLVGHRKQGVELHPAQGVELPPGEAAVVAFKIDPVRWPAPPSHPCTQHACSSPGEPSDELLCQVTQDQLEGAQAAQDRNGGHDSQDSDAGDDSRFSPCSVTPLLPSCAVERVHTLEGLLEAYALFHHDALASLQAAMSHAHAASSAARSVHPDPSCSDAKAASDGGGTTSRWEDGDSEFGRQGSRHEPSHDMPHEARQDAGILPKVLLYTPPAYGWGNRLLDLSACLLLSILSDSLLLVNWTEPVPLSQLIATSAPNAATAPRLLDVTGDDSAARLALFARERSGSFESPHQLDLFVKDFQRRAAAEEEGEGGISQALTAQVVFLRFGLRSLPRFLSPCLNTSMSNTRLIMSQHRHVAIHTHMTCLNTYMSPCANTSTLMWSWMGQPRASMPRPRVFRLPFPLQRARRGCLPCAFYRGTKAQEKTTGSPSQCACVNTLAH
jgi:hypothetical protein